jgi:superfamily II DNA or RNA helicase
MYFKRYQHQQEVLDNIQSYVDSGKSVGRVIVPTGGGKTRIEADVIKKYGIEQENNVSASLVLFHRIALGQQHIGLGSTPESPKGFRQWIGFDGWRAAAFHSGEHSSPVGISLKDEPQTTNVSVIKRHIERQKNLGNYSIIFSTYQSYHKLLDINFDVVIADESQFLVQEKYFYLFKSLKSSLKFCFTATEKWTDSDNGFGLNNRSIFGDRICTIKAVDLIKRGIIVAPKIHVIETSETEDVSCIVDLCIRISKYHHCDFSKTIGFSKTLFAASNSKDLKQILESQEHIRRFMPEHDIFIIHSNEEIGTTRNGMKIKDRNIFLDLIRASKNCLIFHYDILSEGIDISGITGVALLRSMNTCKLLQTIGRALRKYTVNDINIKKYALVTVPVWSNCEDDWVNLQKHIIALRGGGFQLDENIDISYELIKDAKERLNLEKEKDLPDLVSVEVHKSKANQKLKDAYHLLEKNTVEEALQFILHESKHKKDINIFKELYEYCETKGIS